MIKARAVTKDGRNIIFLGIDAVNVERLKDDQPIIVFGKEMGLDHDIVILYGETPQHIVDEIKAAGIRFDTGEQSGTKN